MSPGTTPGSLSRGTPQKSGVGTPCCVGGQDKGAHHARHWSTGERGDNEGSRGGWPGLFWVPSSMSLLPTFLKCKNSHLASWGLLGLPPLLFGAPNLFLVYSHGNHWGSGVLGTSLLLWWEMSEENVKVSLHQFQAPWNVSPLPGPGRELWGLVDSDLGPAAQMPCGHTHISPNCLLFGLWGMRPQLPRSFPHTHHGRYGSYMLPILGTYR